MSITIKNAVLPQNKALETTIFEAPAGKPCIVNSLIAAGIVSASVNVRLQKANGSSSVLINNLTIPPASNADVLSGTVNLEAGDKLIASSPNATFFDNRTLSPPQAGLPAITIASILRFADDLLFCVQTTFLARSTDGGMTWTNVYTHGSNITHTGYVSIGGKLHIYLSATTKLESSDNGLTWTSTSCTLGPTIAGGGAARGDGLFKHTVSGTEYVYGLNATHVTRSTDGTTFNTVGLHGVTGPFFFVKSATKMVVAGTSGVARYSSDDGSTWSNSSGGVTYSAYASSMCAVGDFVVFNGYDGTNASISVSTNGGANFTNISAQLQITGGSISLGGCVGMSDGVFVGGSTYALIRTSGVHQKLAGGLSSYAGAVKLANKLLAFDVSMLYAPYAPYTHPSANLDLNVSHSLTCSYAEVTA